ncbi:hypothetical protein DSBG_2931 [Desulfosporosinus sp. BG]|nr:hypothetical protein DSBG_2931 [Desulfosporosinus sp. BG]
MVDYKEMYSILFNKMTDIIEEIQQIQRQTEEMYMQGQDRELILLTSCKNLDLSDEKDE